jgi:hypothetical protein
MPLHDVYTLKACRECGEINQHGTTCDNPSCPNYCGKLVKVILKLEHIVPDPRG